MEEVFGKAISNFMTESVEQYKRGAEKYGTVLKTWNGRDVHKDILQELIDAVMYLEQARIEYEDLLQAFRSYVLKLEKNGCDCINANDAIPHAIFEKLFLEE